MLPCIGVTTDSPATVDAKGLFDYLVATRGAISIKMFNKNNSKQYFGPFYGSKNLSINSSTPGFHIRTHKK